jgi:NAD dependent epimerase/dehydratase family enzyme
MKKRKSLSSLLHRIRQDICDEGFGVRCVIIRTAVVLSRDSLIMKLMELPARLFFGGRLGSG